MSFQKFQTIRQRFATNKPIVERVLNIFARSGSDDVITHEIVGDNLKVLDFIIKSDEIDQGLNKINLEIDQILQSSSQNFGAHFYFSKYGGSKTQFIAMLNDYFIREKPCVIPIIIEDIAAINCESFFNKIIPRTYEKINSVIQDRTKIYDKFLEIQQFASQIQIGLIGSKTKNEILQHLNEIVSITNNYQVKEKVGKLEALLESIQTADDEKVMDLMAKIMAGTSKLDFIYILFFDEVDLWFKEKEPLEFDKKFIDKTRIIKKVLDLNKSGCKLYCVFCCTDRIYYLLSQHSREFEDSPVASRFCAIFNNSDKTFEDGVYGNKLEDAICQITALFALTKQVNLKEECLTTIINAFKKKYQESTRRIFNSKLLALLNSYKEIIPLIEDGLKKIEEKNWVWIGNIIPDFLPSIFNKLGIKWVREEIPVDATMQRSLKKLDGKFVIGEIDRKVILSEVKTTGVQEFPQKKVEQVVEAVHFRQEPIIMLIWGQFKKDDIVAKITSYINTQIQFDYKIDYVKKIYPIIIDNYLAFAPIIGLNNIRTDANALEKAINATANWLDELSNIRQNLFETWQELGIMPKFEPLKKEPSEKGPETLKQPVKEPPKKDIHSQNAITVLQTLKRKEEFTQSGTKRKATIYKIVKSLGFSIENDLDQIYELLYKKRLISNITNQSITFSAEFITKQSTLKGEEFDKYCQSIILT